SNISIVPGSLTVNGVSNSGDIQSGINIGNLAIGSTAILTYQVKINGTPTPNPIPNTAGAGYIYTRPGGSPTPGTSTSNQVNTNVQGSSGGGDASIIKAVDKATANIGDEITYTSTIQNTGTLPLTNVTFTDALEANGITFVPGSVTVNGVSNTGNPSSGINIGSLAVGASAIVVFRVKINSTPIPNPIPNKSNVQYTYTPSGGSPVTNNKDSNNVTTQVNNPSGNPNTTIVKSVDKTTANIGDTLNYGITVTNTGNLDLTNLIVTDTLQASNISFVPGSLTVNGSPNAGNIQNGVNVGNLAIGQSVLLTYRVTVNAVPVPNPIPNTAIDNYTYTNPSGGQGQGSNTSNQVQTIVNTPGGVGNATVTKTTDKTTAVVGDIITYTLDVLNDGTLPLDNVIVKDILQASNVSFVPGSLTVNGISNGGNVQTGVNVGSLAVGQRTVLVF
ncbi:MAG: DUF7507 domain-containing protein, partial [Clostridium sp.]|uniref:DUF7507 domain-containing protein n=1 Tax=Clostridium sp. TaxID=1506 RepID=UPI003F2FE479